MPPLDTSCQICPRYIEGKCPLPEHVCIFSHNKKDAPLCIQWVDGACPGGNSCFKRHFYSEKDTNSSKSATQDVNRNSSPVFTSPLVVKVKTLTQSQRRVEVDLDSGRRRSWVEQRNLELVDLTGQSSPALSKLLSRARVEKAQDSKNEKAISKNSPPSALSNDDDGNEAERREDRHGRKPRLEGRLDLVNCSNGKNNGKDSYLEKSSGSRYRDREIRYGHKYSHQDNYGSKNGDRENRYSRKYSDREDSYERKKSDRESRYSRKYSDREDSYGRKNCDRENSYGRKNSDRENRYSRKDYNRDKSYGRNHYRHSRPSQKPSSHNRYSSRSRTPRGRTPHAPRRSRSRSTRRRRSRSPSRGKIRSNRPLRSRSMWRKRSRSPMRQRKGSQRRSISLRRRSRSPRREKQRSTRHFRSRSPKKPRFH